MILQIGGYVVLVVVWSVFSVRSFLRKQQTKEAVIYGSLMGVCAVIGSLLLSKAPIPSPLAPYLLLFRPFGELILKK
ncbi:hypothetical protein I8J29_06235 [Paenibacillus sp. MWE-103]|uniref:Uncharacterized protein n=1 Tax=Paenibacillus artemisiicola TaxID=1172618 RepID=A0ABS3W674_9BACL|nr:hypothetical protein [Paenibacillus artemisiicola]MBO7743788.1 hypothetical protein [Paenibacillus artemisiicola]